MRLAKAFDCHLQGVAPVGLFNVPAAAKATTPLSDPAAQADAPHQQAEQSMERFRKECGVADVKSFDAVIEESDQASSFVHHAHCNDLTILTKADPAAPDHGLTQNFVEQVVLHSARPTLILRYAGRFDTIGTIGTNVLVAWNDSREASGCGTASPPGTARSCRDLERGRRRCHRGRATVLRRVASVADAAWCLGGC